MIKFVKFPYDFLVDSQLSSNDKVVLMYIIDKCEFAKNMNFEWNFSIYRIAKALNLSHITINKCINRLCELHYISKFYTYEKKRGARRCYIMLLF